MNSIRTLIIISAALISILSCEPDKKDTETKECSKTIEVKEYCSKNSDSKDEGSITAEPGIITNKYKGSVCDLFVYTPIKLSYHLTNKRPEFSPNNYLSVAAAFTAIDYKTTSGMFIIEGNSIFNTNNDSLTGGCIIDGNSIRILDYVKNNDSLKSAIIANKESFFQQALLVYNKKSIKWNLKHGLDKLQRRALIEFNNQFSICESSTGVDIKTFTSDLINIGVENALYLDMGGWSEGWYKNVDGKQIRIGGENASKSQINWIYLSEN